MLSKNNQTEQERKVTQNPNRFTLRKLNIGVCSVIAGLSFMGLSAHADQVQEDSQPTTPDQKMSDTKTQTLQQKQVVLHHGNEGQANTTSSQGSQQAPTSSQQDTPTRQQLNVSSAASQPVTQATPVNQSAVSATATDPVDVNAWDFSRQADGILLNGFHGTVQNNQLIVPNSYDFTKAGIISQGQKVYLGAYFRRNTGNQGQDLFDHFGDQNTAFSISHNGNGKVIAQGTNWGDAFNGVKYRSMDLANLDVSGVTNMSQMFNSAQCQQITGLNHWDVSHVGNMGSMFMSCVNLTSLDLSNWNTSNVGNMAAMFDSCVNLTTVGDLGNWDVHQVTNMDQMFGNCRNITQVNVANWKVGRVTNFSNMFIHDVSLEQVDLSGWDVGQATTMQSMFWDCEVLTSVGDLSNWNTNNLQDIVMMFMQTGNLKKLDGLSHWNTSHLIQSNAAFLGTGLSNIDIHGWDLSNDKDVRWMFALGTKPVVIDMRGVKLPTQTSFNLMSFFSTKPMVVYSDDSQLLDLNKTHLENYTEDIPLVGYQYLQSLTGHQNTNVELVYNRHNPSQSFNVPVDFVYTSKDNLITSLKQVMAKDKVAALVKEKWPNQKGTIAAKDIDSDGALIPDSGYNTSSPTTLVSNTYPVDFAQKYTQRIVYRDGQKQIGQPVELTGEFPEGGNTTLTQDKIKQAVDDNLPANYYYVSGRPTTDIVINSAHPADIVIQVSNKAAVKVVYKDGQQTLKTTTVPGAIGQQQYLTFIAPAGYQLAQGQVNGQDFTFQKTNDDIIVYVTQLPVSASVKIKYETNDGNVVKRGSANGNVGDTTTLHFIAPDGYQLADGQADSQSFTFQKTNKDVIVYVTQLPVSASVNIKYETSDGNVVKTGSANGNVGDTTTLHFTAPKGYQLADGQAYSQSFTFQKTNEDIIVYVTQLPVSASVNIKYETSDGNVVKTGSANGNVGDTTTLHFIAPRGYQLADGQADSQSFTFQKTNKDVIVYVTQLPVSASVKIKYETSDGTVVKTESANGNVGDTTTLHFTAPKGYQLADGQADSQSFTFQKTNDDIIVYVTQIPVSASVKIKYETSDGKVIKIDSAAGNVGDTTTLHFIAPEGYDLATGQANSEAFTFQRENQDIIVPVIKQASVRVIYVDEQNQQVVKTDQPINGHVGDRESLNITLPDNYELDPNYPQPASDYVLTDQPNQVVTVYVRRKAPAAASVKIIYQTTTGMIVKTDTVGGYVGEQTHLTFTAPDGYEIVSQLPSADYTFAGNDQPIIIIVQAKTAKPDHGQPTTPTDNHGHETVPTPTKPQKPTTSTVHQTGSLTTIRYRQVQ